MPCGRMQHTAALPRGKSYSAYASNAIASTRKKNFLQTFFRLPKLWNEIGELGLIFFFNWLIPFWNPLPIICRVASFDGTDNLPIKFLGHAASIDMLQLSRCNVHIYLWHGATFAAWPCRTLPLCATRHSVDIPLWKNDGFFHSFCNFLKCNAFGENFIRTKLISIKFSFDWVYFRAEKPCGCFSIYVEKIAKNHLWEDMTILRERGVWRQLKKKQYFPK